MPLALGGLCDLLDRAFEDVAKELAEPQRRLLGVALGLEAPADETPDRIALPRAFVACLRAGAARGPVLVAIDDVQWLDAAFQADPRLRASRRLGDARVGILATQRGDAEDPLDLAPRARRTIRRGPPRSVERGRAPASDSDASRRTHPAPDSGAGPRVLRRQSDVRARVRALAGGGRSAAPRADADSRIASRSGTRARGAISAGRPPSPRHHRRRRAADAVAARNG